MKTALATPKFVDKLFETLNRLIKSFVIDGLTSRMVCAISSSVSPLATVRNNDN